MRWVSLKEGFPTKKGKYLVKVYDALAEDRIRYESLLFGERTNMFKWNKGVLEWLDQETSESVNAYEYYINRHILIRLVRAIIVPGIPDHELKISKLIKEFENSNPKLYDQFVNKQVDQSFLCEKEDYEHEKCLQQCPDCIKKYVK